MERFLHGLIQRHCNFHIVFFDVHRELCIPPGIGSPKRPKYLLARSVIRRHLKVNLGHAHPSIRIETFWSPQDSHFLNYLEATGVYFVMCHDGASVRRVLVDARGVEEDKESLNPDRQEISRKTWFRYFMLKLIAKGYNIALINGLEFVDTKVNTIWQFLRHSTPTDTCLTGYDDGRRGIKEGSDTAWDSG